MCGIAGIVGDFNIQELDAMLGSQHHRGPDATGKYADASFAVLGHNRLAIIDLSVQSNQPFLDSSGRYALVFNGEIYNYIELKASLKNQYTFKTESDTEVLLAAFIIYGTDCLQKLNGMFAFAIWDKELKKMFAARDRFGVKPFYYSIKNSSFYFSSEIKALHAAEIPKIPYDKVWASYFAYGTYGHPDETFWEAICQLPGGHFLEYENQKLQIKKWYSFEEEVAKQPKNLTYALAKEHYLILLKDSIRLRFRADVPVGFNISGGLDSSVLLAMVNSQENANNNSNNCNAYTFYTNNLDYDELPWVEAMIAKTDNPLIKVLLQADEVPALARKMESQQDEPYGGIPTLAYAKLFEQARKDKVLVLLDGQGMDEQWAGYDYYTLENEATVQGVDHSPYKINMLSDSFLAKAEKPVYPKPFEDVLLNKQYRDLFYTKIPRALRFNDRISMMYSTELREPFLDYRLVEFAFSLPLNFKIKNEVTKYMLREIASDYLADDLVFTPKRPLQTPQREWLADDLKVWVQECFEGINNSNYSSWFSQEELQKELQLYMEGDFQSSFHIWQCVNCFKSIFNLKRLI
ncbi:asparagine synthase (glutamine-hydrolysing) [Flavobacterium fryxellicola]|uniref:asparagine synthase (glutamine-hydrolyzing) n=1 Tax=Flavobacterium fryxellicola TaxID=249352 RepID=A0A167XCY7_9FLAO|nr:asparagine synthase (glutamine-hydrolyzing) [Flavobacterium fryxellicola]OAB28232.1 asparagine synthetase B [Flavobacterium fryxellicola]SHN66144.1 asparagine synthase (glutamine-hydrolysing) [Flavobacterium fryxellicola]